jgi:hypothetical protein
MLIASRRKTIVKLMSHFVLMASLNVWMRMAETAFRFENWSPHSGISDIQIR